MNDAIIWLIALGCLTVFVGLCVYIVGHFNQTDASLSDNLLASDVEAQ